MAWRPGDLLTDGYIDARGVTVGKGGTISARLRFDGKPEVVTVTAEVTPEHFAGTMGVGEPYSPNFPPALAGKVFAFAREAPIDALGKKLKKHPKAEPSEDYMEGFETDQSGSAFDYIRLGWGANWSGDDITTRGLTFAWFSNACGRVCVEADGMAKDLSTVLPDGYREVAA